MRQIQPPFLCSRLAARRVFPSPESLVQLVATVVRVRAPLCSCFCWYTLVSLGCSSGLLPIVLMTRMLRNYGP